jgi:dsRNA-specific ribonuclease
MPDGTALRTLVSVRLFDTSVVTYPAYSNTSAQARNVVASHVEARMAALTLAQGIETRRKRADDLLAEIAQEQADEDTKRLKLRRDNLYS